MISLCFERFSDQIQFCYDLIRIDSIRFDSSVWQLITILCQLNETIHQFAHSMSINIILYIYIYICNRLLLWFPFTHHHLSVYNIFIVSLSSPTQIHLITWILIFQWKDVSISVRFNPFLSTIYKTIPFFSFFVEIFSRGKETLFWRKKIYNKFHINCLHTMHFVLVEQFDNNVMNCI